MKRYITIGWSVRTLTLLCFIFLAIMLQTSCKKKDLTIQQNYPFELRIMPVPKTVNKGKRVEIRVSILSGGTFTGASYHLRYFQYSGSGALQYFEEGAYRPNDSYLLPEKEFRLYYTSKSETAHSFDIWISDNFGNEKQVSFEFDNR